MLNILKFSLLKRITKFIGAMILTVLIGLLILIGINRVLNDRYFLHHYPHGFLFGEITEGSVLKLELQILSLPYGSDLDVYIDSPGGSVMALNTLLTFIKVNNIHVHSHVIASSFCASAAANFLADSDTQDVDNAAIIVYHLGSLGDKRLTMNDSDVFIRILARSAAQMVKAARDKCLITKDEYQRVLAGEDVFVLGEEVNYNKLACKGK